MPRHDEHTEEFMRRVMGEDVEGHSRDTTRPIRYVKNLIGIAENPKKNLPKFIVRTTTREVLEKDGSLNVLGVYKYLNDHFGKAWWDWEPETLWATLEKEHLSTGTPDEVKNMVMALQTALNTFAPFEHWHIFEKTCHAFNQNHVDFGLLQPTEPHEAASTIQLLAKIRPNTEYDSEVLQYIAVCANVAGLVYLPEELFPGVQKYLDGMTFDHSLRDETKKLWDSGISGYQFKDDISRYQLEVQLGRLGEIKRYVSSEVR